MVTLCQQCPGGSNRGSEEVRTEVLKLNPRFEPRFEPAEQVLNYAECLSRLQRVGHARSCSTQSDDSPRKLEHHALAFDEASE